MVEPTGYVLRQNFEALLLRVISFMFSDKAQHNGGRLQYIQKIHEFISALTICTYVTRQVSDPVIPFSQAEPVPLSILWARHRRIASQRRF